MAKKKAKKKCVSDIMDTFIGAAQKKLGAGAMYSAEKHEQHHVGVPLPSLSLEYLFGSNILYLGAAYGLAGPSQSFKSALGMEFGRIIASRGGYNFLGETEGGKISAKLISSIYGDLRQRLTMRLVDSVESTQDYISFTFDWIKKNFPDRDQMFGLFIDSLNGPSSDDRHKAMQKDGHAKRDFPVEALLWSKWFQDWVPKLTGWPTMLIFVNHQKIDVGNPNSFRHPGGDAQDFYSTVFTHVRRAKINEGVDAVVNQLVLKTVKHSFMLPGRKINTAFVVDKARKRMFFDWGHSTADLLAGDQVPATVKDVLNVTTSSQSITALTRTFSCKELGLVKVTGAELGAAVHADEQLMQQLREILYIQTHDVWDGIMPEEAMIDNGVEATAEEADGTEDDLDMVDG